MAEISVEQEKIKNKVKEASEFFNNAWPSLIGAITIYVQNICDNSDYEVGSPKEAFNYDTRDVMLLIPLVSRIHPDTKISIWINFRTAQISMWKTKELDEDVGVLIERDIIESAKVSSATDIGFSSFPERLIDLLCETT